jgi:hypothetical protein
MLTWGLHHFPFEFVIDFFNFFFISNRIKPPNNPLNRKSEPVKIDLYFMDGLSLVFLLYDLTWVTTLDPNPPKPAKCPHVLQLKWM